MSLLKDKMQIDNKVYPKRICSGKEIDLTNKDVESMNFAEWKNKEKCINIQDVIEALDNIEQETYMLINVNVEIQTIRKFLEELNKEA